MAGQNKLDLDRKHSGPNKEKDRTFQTTRSRPGSKPDAPVRPDADDPTRDGEDKYK